VPDKFADLRHELAVANRILAHEGVIDAFGHVSIRHPDDPDRYFLSRSRSPELVEPGDILEFDLDSRPIDPPTVQLYAERVIHGEIFKARPDVVAVCHHHAPAVMPFCISGDPIVPVFHLGAAMGALAPFWDSRDEFGDTNLLVVTPAEGASLARALGKHSMVLMRRHGATVVGASLRELVFRAIYSCDNARYLSEAKRLGNFSPLTPGEIEMAQAIYQLPTAQGRAWEYWETRSAKRGGALVRRTGVVSDPHAPLPLGLFLPSPASRGGTGGGREVVEEWVGWPTRTVPKKTPAEKTPAKTAEAKKRVKPKGGKRK
jgi:ribulose-5-phosphate 4-epimerase/fuculose-1-phosphate aldolase